MKQWQIVVPSDFATTEKEYQINGRSYHRVTMTLSVIAKHRLFQWASRVGQDVVNKTLETRQVIGTHVHKLIELTLQGTDVNLGAYEKEIREDMCRFFEFQQVAELLPDGLEQRLWSNVYGYAGTADYVGNYKSPLKFLVRGHQPKFLESSYVIGDWKTGKDIYPQYWLQLAAYAMAFKELTGVQVDGVFICRLRDGKVKVKEMTWDELTELFDVYLAVLKVYKWKYRLGDD